MKLFSSTLLVFAVATFDGGSVAAVELRGNNNHANNGIGATAKATVATAAKAATAAAAGQQEQGKQRVLQQITETPLNAGLTFAPISAVPPLPPPLPDSCIPVNSTTTGEPDMLEEYVVVQYNSSMFEGAADNYPTSDTPSVDFTNRTSTFEVEITYQYAYELALGVCPQVGAFREVYAVEVIAYNVTQSTFLLRVGTDSNAAQDRFQSVPMNDNCGIVMYNATTADVNQTLDTDYNYAGYGRRNRQLQPPATQVVGGVGPESVVQEVCDCAPPTALEVLTYFNEAMVLTFNDTRFANWTTSTQQLCIIPDCVPAASTVGSTGKNTLIAAPTATYNATGVCLAADLPAFSRAPSIMPSSEPTGTYEPTGTWEPTNTDAPTLEKPSENPTGTDAPTGAEDSQAPTGTPNPTGTEAPSGDTTTTPTASPSTDTTTTPTASPSSADDTTTPTASPTTETTSAPTEETTSAPTPDTTDPPTPELTTASTPEPTPEPTPESTPGDTPSPVAPSGNYSGYGRFLVWDGEHMVVEEVSQLVNVDESSSTGAGALQQKTVTREVTVNQAPFAYAQGRHSCQEVDAKLVDNAANRKLCQSYLELPYIRTTPITTTTTTGEDTETAVSSCPQQQTVPHIYWSVSKSQEQSQTQVGITFSNPSYERKHYGDGEALDFITQHCGAEVGQAYECLAPAAYRADLFRFCALYTHGGLYLDSDLLPLVPLEDLYDPCAVATVGHDWPQGKPQKQMKILAGQAGAPIFLCMIQQIVANVKARSYPDNPLALTGPMALQDCYVQYSDEVAITYHDTRDAAYPYSGMRAVQNGDGESTLLAFESPNDHHNNKNYQLDFEKHEVYRSTCPLPQEKKETNNNNNVNNNSVKISNA